MANASSTRAFPRGRAIFVLGIALFVLAKGYLLLATYLPSGMARLGDDSLIYLWKGKLALMGDGRQYPALRDILHQEEIAPPSGDNVRTAVHQVYSGSVRPLGDIFYGLLLKLGLDLKWTAFLSEIIGLCAMTAGMAALLHRLFGPAAAGAGMLLLAFAVLPNQGIYSYIPSTAAMSLGLLFWAYLLGRTGRVSPWPSAIAAFVIASVHPVGKMYCALAPFFHASNAADWRDLLSRERLLLYAAIAGGAAVSALWPILWPPFAYPSHVLTGGLATDASLIRQNAEMAASLLLDPGLRKNLILVVCAAIGLAVLRKQTLPGRTAWLLAFLAAMCALSILHHLPGNPAELLTRLLVPTTVLLAGVGGGTIVLLGNGRGWRTRLFRAFFLVAILLAALNWGRNYSIDKLNERLQIIEEPVFSEQLSRIAPGSSLVYPEMDYSINASLLLGGYKLGAIAYPTLSGKQALLSRVMEDKRPAAIIAPHVPSLNSLAHAKARTLEPRRLGLYLKQVAGLEISFPPHEAVDRLAFRVSNRGEAFVLKFKSHEEDRWQSVNVPAHYQGWLEIRLAGKTHDFKVDLPRVPAWIEGLRTGRGNEFTWPWGSEAMLTYESRVYRKEANRYHRVAFSVASLLGSVNAMELLPWVSPSAPVLAEAGGFIFLRTIYGEDRLPSGMQQ